MNRSGHNKIKNSYRRFLLTLSTLCLVGCAKPVPIDLNNVCQASNDNKYVSVEGYLTTGPSVLCSSSEGKRTCGLELLDKPDGTSKISVYVEEGTGKSQMEPLPSSYSKESLKIRVADGQFLGPQDRVRVIGIAKIGTDVANSSYSICYLTIDEIEKP